MKLHITTSYGISDELAARLVHKVIGMGKISTKRSTPCYCFMTSFDTEVGEVHVYAELTRAGNHTFGVYSNDF